MITTQMYRTLCGDAREQQRQLEAGSIHMAFNSPPYWGLRAYLDHPDEIGRETSLQQWLDNLVAVYRETWRVLRNDGTLWVNCGDSYASAAKGPRSNDKSTLNAPGWQINAQPPGLQKGWRNCNGLKRKDLLGLPWRLAFALQADGWYLRSAITWVKGIDWTDSERGAQEAIRDALALVRQQVAGNLFGMDKATDKALRRAEKAVDRLVQSGSVIPESVKDRPTTSSEMLFVFTKSKRYYWDKEAIKIPVSASTHSRGCGHTPKEDADSGTIRANRSFHEATYKHVLSARSARNVWRIGTENHGTFVLADGTEVSHFAAFPSALAERAIKAATSQVGVCAKCGAPFKRVTKLTVEYAKLLGRDWADYEQDAKEGRGHSVSTQRTTKRGKTATASYETIAWIPTCHCYGEPVAKGVVCPACDGTGIEHAYSRGNVEYRNLVNGALATQRSPQCDYDGRGFVGKQPTGRPCFGCRCSDCHGTGVEIASSKRNDNCDDHPCLTCQGRGATGHVNADTWPAEMLEAWSRVPATVLDMFGGSGTTGRAALNLGRQVVLIDLNPLYCRLMEERLAAWPRDVTEKRRGGKKKKELVDLPLFASVRREA